MGSEKWSTLRLRSNTSEAQRNKTFWSIKSVQLTGMNFNQISAQNNTGGAAVHLQSNSDQVDA